MNATSKYFGSGEEVTDTYLRDSFRRLQLFPRNNLFRNLDPREAAVSVAGDGIISTTDMTYLLKATL